MAHISVVSREYEVRELIPHIGLIPKVIPLKLFLDMAIIPAGTSFLLRNKSLTELELINSHLITTIQG